MLNQTTYPTNLHPDLTVALHTALHAGDYRPIASIIHGMYRKKGHRGSLEKYITYDFTEYLQVVRNTLLHTEPVTKSVLISALENFIVELYKASVRGQIIGIIINIVNTL